MVEVYKIEIKLLVCTDSKIDYTKMHLFSREDLISKS